MFAEEAVIGEIAAKVIIVPADFPFDPRLGGNRKVQPLLIPGSRGTGQISGWIRGIFLHQFFDRESFREISVQKADRPALIRVERELSFE